MILAIDIGNTNIVIGAYRGESLQFLSRIMTSRDKTADEMAVSLRDILALYQVDPTDLDGSIVSSVVPAVTDTVAPAVTRITGKAPLIVGPGIKTGLNIKIDNPAQLGADLVVDAVAALAKYPRPIVIFDMGTATTISVINRAGEMLGGAILPGVRLGLGALSRSAAQLPEISVEAPARVIGTNTVDCMRSGVVFGAAAMLDGMLERIEAELGAPCTAVATGGMSGEITKFTRRKVLHDPHLLLEGLRILYGKNCGK